VQAGESDGGWWFVCDACDNIWDQRQFVTVEREEADQLRARANAAAYVGVSATLFSKLFSWWRVLRERKFFLRSTQARHV
jgi:hypothetical protein